MKKPVYYLRTEPAPVVMEEEEVSVPLEARDFMLNAHLIEIKKLLRHLS